MNRGDPSCFRLPEALCPEPGPHASVGWRQSLARFYVIGSNTPAEILELASGDIIRTGYVSDVIGYSRDRRLSVAPLRYDAGVKG